jgi:hypothetical protein
MIRMCRDAHPSPIMAEGERPKVFQTKGEAAEECGEVFDGPSVKEAKFARAEKLFRKDAVMEMAR